jgi:hypothetical protein
MPSFYLSVGALTMFFLTSSLGQHPKLEVKSPMVLTALYLPLLLSITFILTSPFLFFLLHKHHAKIQKEGWNTQILKYEKLNLDD